MGDREEDSVGEGEGAGDYQFSMFNFQFSNNNQSRAQSKCQSLEILNPKLEKSLPTGRQAKQILNI